MEKGQSGASARSGKEEHARALLRLVEEGVYRSRRQQVFADFIELSCLAISNAVDREQYAAREARYLEIVGKYPREDVERFPRMLGHLTMALEDCCHRAELDDVLGQIYMQAEFGNEWAGQFFTPFDISRLCAHTLIDDGELVREWGFIDIMEPTCGSGGMVIALAETLQHSGLNYQHAMHATCIDIDVRCVHMTYLQLALLHIPAIVLHGNSLSDEVWSRWYTPAHVLGGWRQRLAARRASEPVPMQTKKPQEEPAHDAPDAPLAKEAAPIHEQLKLFGE